MISVSAWKTISMCFFFNQMNHLQKYQWLALKKDKKFSKPCMDLNVIVICVKKKVEIHDQMEYLPDKDCKISEFIPSSKTSTKKFLIITLQKWGYLLRFFNLYHNQMKLKDVCLEGCENSSKDYLSKNPYLVI